MRRLALVILGALLALLVSIAPAVAAESSATTQPAVTGTPAEPSLIDVQLWPQDIPSGMTLVVIAVVPTSSPLPATVSIPLPKGATVTWAGEIFQNQAQDVQRQPVVAEDGASIALTTKGSRVLQYEAQYKPFVDRGGRRYAALEWVQTKPSAVTRFAYSLPTSSDDVKSDPPYAGAPEASGGGDKVYSIGDKKLAVGSTFTLKVDYRPGNISELPPVEAKRPDIVLPILVGLLAAAVAVLIAVFLRQRRDAA